MRLLTRRIYRAFPELDRYSDEQCTRFVRAARRAFWPRVGRLTVRVIGYVLWCALILGALWAVGQYSIFEKAFMFGGIGRMLLAVAVTAMAFGVIPGLGWFLWRDVQLRRRIRKILRARTTCPGCGYRLVGLFVSPDHKVRCPECGMETEVDPSLEELATDEAGRARFNPSPPVPTWWQKWLTPRGRRNLRRITIAAITLVAVGPPMGWGGYELFLRHQAAVALRERPGVSGLEALVEKYQPVKGGDDVPDAWALFEQAVTLMDATDSKLWKGGWPKTSAGRETAPDFSGVYAEPTGALNAEDQESARLARAAALRAMAVYEKVGLFDELDKVAACPRAVRPITLPPGQPMVGMILPSLGKTRQCARACAARMMLAALDGDRDKCVRSFEEMLALSRIVAHQPLLIDQLVSIAISALACQRGQTVLASHPGDDWIDGLQAALDRQAVKLPPSYMSEGERLAALDTIAWEFSDPGRVRWGRFSKGVAALGGGGIGSLSAPLGTYWSNRDAINAQSDWFSAALAKERFERPPATAPSSNLAMVQLLAPSYGKAIHSRDQVLLEQRGLRLALALERYRNRHGQYPARLADLVPVQIERLPLDPWSGKPLGYKQVDPASDPCGRSYLIYSVGADGSDDGGVAGKDRYGALWQAGSPPAVPGAAGVDFIIFEPGKAPPRKDLVPLPDPASQPEVENSP